MTGPFDNTAQSEIYVLVEPEDKALCDLLARRRVRRIAIAVAPVVLLGVGAAVLLVALGRGPEMTEQAAFAHELPAPAAVLEPVHVRVQPQRVNAPELSEPSRSPGPLPTPAAPAASIGNPHPAGADLIGIASMPAMTTATPTRHSGLPTPQAELRDRAAYDPWVITLRNGSEFVVDRALFTEEWVTLWVDDGVVALPIEDVRAHGRRGN